MAAPEKPSRTLASQTLFRGLDIIDAVAEGVVTVATISARTGISPSTTHRLASALVQIRYLKFEPRKGYSLGSKLIELGFQAHEESDLLGVARPILETLSAQTLDTVHLAALEDGAVIYLDKLPGQRTVRVSSRVGGRKPVATTGVGKALLLDRSEEQWKEQFQLDREYLGKLSWTAWLKLMRAYAKSGYAFDLGEDEPVVRCVAAPIRDVSGDIIAAISVSSAVEYMDPARMQTLIPIVVKAAQKISAEIGGGRTSPPAQTGFLRELKKRRG
ncbi:IclR family transcriptional regulator [Herbaspirillum sp. NPDC087042]|uniref:IclR family transcriptional regulator n=1 Tax=Herbaspirillum sp. NPDC087042 TaxID=3364004 RepID=UPI0037F3563A